MDRGYLSPREKFAPSPNFKVVPTTLCHSINLSVQVREPWLCHWPRPPDTSLVQPILSSPRLFRSLLTTVRLAIITKQSLIQSELSSSRISSSAEEILTVSNEWHSVTNQPEGKAKVVSIHAEKLNATVDSSITHFPSICQRPTGPWVVQVTRGLSGGGKGWFFRIVWFASMEWHFTRIDASPTGDTPRRLCPSLSAFSRKVRQEGWGRGGFRPVGGCHG